MAQSSIMSRTDRNQALPGPTILGVKPGTLASVLSHCLQQASDFQAVRYGGLLVMTC